jgi:hypothetical protein
MLTITFYICDKETGLKYLSLPPSPHQAKNTELETRVRMLEMQMALAASASSYAASPPLHAHMGAPTRVIASQAHPLPSECPLLASLLPGAGLTSANIRPAVASNIQPSAFSLISVPQASIVHPSLVRGVTLLGSSAGMGPNPSGWVTGGSSGVLECNIDRDGTTLASGTISANTRLKSRH